MSASVEVFEGEDPLSDQQPDLSSLTSPEDTETWVPTPKCCPNCATLKEENRKLRNQCVTLRESSQKRLAKIRKLQRKGNHLFKCCNHVSNMQAQIILCLPILVQKQDDMLKDSPLHAEETATDVLDEPMEALSEDKEHDDHEMEEEDDEGSVYQTETETTELEMEGDFEQEIG